MIDLESDIFTAVADAVITNHPGVAISGEYADSFSRLPAVTIEERDNTVVESMRTLNIENYVAVMYEVNVYSNKSNTGKTEAKSIFNTVDTAFANAGFTRTYRNSIPNFQDMRIYRIVARYEAVIGEADNGSYLIYHN